MSETKKQAIAQAVIPTCEKPSTYSNFVPSPYYGRMRDGQIVEPGDEDEERYEDGYTELRRNALKAAKRR